MIVTHGSEFTAPSASHPQVGYHGTSSLAAADIEAHGFLPNKVLSDQEHAQILQLAEDLGFDTWSYTQWLGMKFGLVCEGPSIWMIELDKQGRVTRTAYIVSP